MTNLHHGKASQKTHYFVSWSDSTSSEKIVCALFPKSNLFIVVWYGVVFNWASNNFCVALFHLRTMLYFGLQTSHHFLNKRKVKPSQSWRLLHSSVLRFTPASFVCFELWLLLRCAVCANLDYICFYDTNLKAALYFTHQGPLNEAHDLEFRGWFISVAWP